MLLTRAFAAALAAGLAGALMMPGCGSDPESDCEAWVRATCDQTFACAPQLAAYTYPDPDTCATRLATLCPAYLALPDTSLSGGMLGQCASDIEGASCDAFTTDFSSAACDAATRGTRAPGKRCNHDVQCDSGYCRRESANPGIFACGTCTRLREQGESCTGPNDVCDLDLFCQGVCKPAKDVGESCALSACLYGLVCTHGVCAEPPDVGATCTTQYDCNYTFGDLCTNGSCSVPTPLFVGEQCASSATGTYDFCAAGDYCEAASGTPGGYCVPTLNDGATCAVVAEDPCTPPATCTGGSCQLPSPSSCR